MSCRTCGSLTASWPHMDSYPESAKCQCGFRQKTDVCSDCYHRFPHNKDDNGVDVFCPECHYFIAYFQWSQL